MPAKLSPRNHDAAVAERGRKYFQQRRVTLQETRGDVIRARVRGLSNYRVELVLDRHARTFDGTCNCVYYEDRGSTCKHIYATFYAVEAAGLLDGPSTGAAPAGRTPAPAKKQPKPKPPTAWQRQLAEIAATHSRHQEDYGDFGGRSWRPDRQVLYLVDLEAPAYHYQEPGALTVATWYRLPKKGGGWNKPNSFSVDRFDIDSFPDTADRFLLPLLLAQDLANESYDYRQDSFEIAPEHQHLVLEHVCRSGRGFLRGAKVSPDWTPLTWDAAGPWEPRLTITMQKNGKQLAAALRLRREEEELEPAACGFFSGSVFLRPGGLAAKHLGPSLLPWTTAFASGPVLAPSGDADELLALLHRLPGLPPLELPPELRCQERTVPPRPRVHIRRPEFRWGAERDKLLAELSFEYGKVTLPANDLTPRVYHAESRSILIRDSAAEAAAQAEFQQAGVGWANQYGVAGWFLPSKRLPKVVGQFAALGWKVEADGKLYRTSSGDPRIEVVSGIDWFELDGAADFDGQTVAFPRLLATLRRGENLVRLDDGSFGIIPEAWLKRFGLLAQLSTTDETQTRFRSSQAGLLDVLLAELPEASFDATFQKVRREIRDFEGIQPAQPHASFTGTLRPYQEQGLGWFGFLRRLNFGGCLADDMGLGKTVQVLALLAERKASGVSRPTLVVVPRSLVFNWQEEVSRFAPGLRVLDHAHKERDRAAVDFTACDLVLTTYGVLRKDILQLSKIEFDYVILDEAQAVKNERTESAKAVRLLKANHRLALSGTPIENHLGELWSLFEFLNPGMLGTASVFQGGLRQPTEETRSLLARALRPFLLRRTKEQVAKDLPVKVEQTVYCEMEPTQKRLYRELLDFIRGDLLGKVDRLGLAVAKLDVLESLLRLRQAACHPGLVDKKRVDAESAKFDLLLPRLEEVVGEGRKALVFSQFTSLLALLKPQLDKLGLPHEYLDGKTRDRQAKVERFQKDPDCKLFLISLKAGGVGLNLTAAEYVFLLDPWWNPAVEAQAIDRTHRIGQDKHVFAYRLITKGTVEEKVLELQRHKRGLADAILNADSGLLRQLTREDLELLLS